MFSGGFAEKTSPLLALRKNKRGKLADLVVLGQDPFKVDPSSLIKIPVERTMVVGKWVYES
ncbi:MAG: amidohydrolase [Acidobacteriaceae bacterium]|nr:amidohydrolase [Acidobacteriaceae bacterium]